VLPPVPGRGLITVDPLIHGVHFDHRTGPRAAGAKLLKRNLSDIAAMGGQPRAAVVALALDPRVSLAWLAAFYRGLAFESRRFGVPIVGGDIATLKGGLVASLTLLGSTRQRVLTRTGGRRGDWIYVTGALGRSFPTGHHSQFQPRLAEGAWLARRPEVRSMMDVSDGLAKDLRCLTPAGLAPAVYASQLPRRDDASVAEAMGDGEDYELVFCVAGGTRRARFEAAWRRAFPRVRLTWIGRLVASGGVPPEALALGDHHGYEHLR